jgi:hypothetical protein
LRESSRIRSPETSKLAQVRFLLSASASIHYTTTDSLCCLDGTTPLGGQAVDPAGSCPANPSGPVTDGAQLNALVQNPGTGSNTGNSGSGSGNGNRNGNGKGRTVEPGAAPATGADNASGTVTVTVTQVQTVTVTAGNAGPTPASNSNSNSGTPAANTGDATSFKLQNGIDAQKLNKSFASLTASSSCEAGDQACVDGGFAQCVGGKFQVSACSGGTQCFALPLVNKAGTSVTCDTQADAEARIAATGATGGVQG